MTCSLVVRSGALGGKAPGKQGGLGAAGPPMISAIRAGLEFMSQLWFTILFTRLDLRLG